MVKDYLRTKISGKTILRSSVIRAAGL